MKGQSKGLQPGSHAGQCRVTRKPVLPVPMDRGNSELIDRISLDIPGSSEQHSMTLLFSHALSVVHIHLDVQLSILLEA